MFNIIRAFKDIAEFSKALKEYFALKNKVLWEGSIGQGESVIIQGISKYQSARIYTIYGSILINPQDGRLRGLFPDPSSASSTAFDYINIAGTIKGDEVSIGRCNYFYHLPSGGHGGATTTVKIIKVVGLEPKLPPLLQSLIGGGQIFKMSLKRRCHLCLM